MAKKEAVEVKLKELLSGHCWEPLKEAAEEWLDAAEDEAEAIAKDKLIPMLKGGVATVDEMLETFQKAEVKEKFGEMADQILEHAKELKAKGEKYCDCPACTKAKEILAELEAKLD